MALKRYIIEFGTGADLHGENVTKASKRAVKDAISHCCLCGLMDILGLDDPNKMYIEAKIGCPYPERVIKEDVLKEIPFGKVNLQVVEGGLINQGLYLPALGESDRIVIAVAALTVYVDID